MSVSKLSDPTRIRDEMLVEGFTKIDSLNTYTSIPLDIVHVLYMFYHTILIETFTHYNEGVYKLENYNTELHNIKRMRGGDFDCVAYGSQCIKSWKQSVHSWTFKIISITKMWDFTIGIDETRYKRRQFGNFDSKTKTKSYALWSNGYRCKHGRALEYIRKAPRFDDANDIVTMILDLKSRTLSYQVNKCKSYKAFKNIKVDRSIEYCMGVCITCHRNSVQLLSYNEYRD